MLTREQRTQQAGFTLIELLVGLVITFVIVFPFLTPPDGGASCGDANHGYAAYDQDR